MTQQNTKGVLHGATLAGLMAAWMTTAGVCAAEPARLHSYRGLALSASGERIAALESVEGIKTAPRVTVRDAASGKIAATYDSAECGDCRFDAPVWSPDGKAIALIGTDAKAGTARVLVLQGDKLVTAATIKGVASTVRWSPDGRQLAVLATVNPKKLTGAVEAGARQVGEIGLAQAEDEQRIALIPATGGALRLVSPADTFIYEYDWTPDGKGFVVTSAKGNGDNNWWIATLGRVDAASGQLRVLAAPKMQMNMPHVSPDGRTVAFIGGLMSDFGSVGGDVFTVALDAAAAPATPVDVTPGYKGTFNGIRWQGQALLASVQAGADSGIASIDPARPGADSVRLLWKAPVSSSGSRDGRFVFSADGTVAASVQEDYEHAPRIVAGRLPALAPITQDNEGLAPQVKAQSVSWTSEGFNVQGWLVGPRSVEPGKKYPMIVQVHGGPAAAVTPRYVAGGAGGEGGGLVREFVNKGYFVFMPNPRGSYGQGLAFSSANKRDFGGGDWRDILAGVDAAIAQAPVDGSRLGLTGHSYGGYMTMWGVTHSLRFKAAVASAGIANWISYYGQNGIDQWMVPFFGATMYEDPAIYRAASPIESIKSARTPTLVLVGERDVECPPAQSFEFWHGLKAQGVPTALVVYADEGHAIRKPENAKDHRVRTLAWFDQYLK